MEQPTSFTKALEELINRYSLGGGSDTPDFILAEYLDDCLQTYNKASKARDKWFSSKQFQAKDGDVQAH